LLAALLAFAAF